MRPRSINTIIAFILLGRILRGSTQIKTVTKQLSLYGYKVTNRYTVLYGSGNSSNG